MDPKSKPSEDSALEQSDRLSALTELNPNPIIELDVSLIATYQNAAARMKFPDLIRLKAKHPVLMPLAKVITEIFEMKSDFVVFEQEITVKEINYEVQIFFIRKNARIYLFMTDATSRKQAEKAKKEMAEQLFQSQKMEAIGQLTGGIAHDFNNILTVIQGNLQLLKTGFPTDSKELKRITGALEATARAAELSKRLLAFSRRGHLEPKVIVLPNFMEEMVKLLKPTLGKSIEISCKVPENVGTINVDPGQLENVILNIVVNARDAMKGQGKITIQVRNCSLSAEALMNTQVRPGDYVQISIQDTGSGISKEILPHIFEPFYTTKEVGKGTGLGLSQVFGFVTQSQGHVHVETEEGKGSTFHLFFPKIASNEAFPEESPVSCQKLLSETTKTKETKSDLSKPSPDIQGKETILLVEDDDAIRAMTAEYLGSLGYTIIEANTAVSALELLKKNSNIDLIFSDVIMPGSYTGPQLVKEAQKIKPSLKALLTSGFPRDALQDGNAFTLLLKPYKLDELAKRLRQVL